MQVAPAKWVGVQSVPRICEGGEGGWTLSSSPSPVFLGIRQGMTLHLLPLGPLGGKAHLDTNYVMSWPCWFEAPLYMLTCPSSSDCAWPPSPVT